MKHKINLRFVMILLLLTFLTGIVWAGGEQEVTEEKVVIRYATYMYQGGAGKGAPILDAVKERLPGIELDILDIPPKEYLDKMLVLLAAGDDIDLFLNKGNAMFAAMVNKNYALSLDELVAERNYDLSPFSSSIGPCKIDGKLYGLASTTYSWILYYNKNLFDNVNLAYPTNDWTWMDFEEAAKKLTKGEGLDKTYGAYIHTWASAHGLPGLQTRQGDIVDGSYDMYKRGLDMFYRMEIVDKTAPDWGMNMSIQAHYSGMFYNGNIAMVPMGDWFTSKILRETEPEDLGFEWDVVQMPTWEDGYDATIGSVEPISINKNTEKLEDAWVFLTNYTGKDSAKILAKGSLTKAGYWDDDVATDYASFAGAPAGVIAAMQTNEIIMEQPAHELGGLMNQMITEEFSMIFTGNSTVDEGIAEMEKRRKEIKER